MQLETRINLFVSGAHHLPSITSSRFNGRRSHSTNQNVYTYSAPQSWLNKFVFLDFLSFLKVLCRQINTYVKWTKTFVDSNKT